MMNPELRPCPAPPCLDLQGFLRWCSDNAVLIVEFGFIGHVRSGFQAGFFTQSHCVAYGEDNDPLQCAVIVWPEPKVLANIDDFRRKLHQYIID